jgi:hypothetical protein
MAEHDLVFYEKRSTPKVVKKGERVENPPASYGKQTKRRAATQAEEKVLASGQWLRVDESGKKGGEDGYKETKMPGREHLLAHGNILSDAEDTDFSRKAIEWIGRDPDDLGCVMLEVDLPGVYRMVLEPEWEYRSPVKKFMSGYDIKSHITLLYGLLFRPSHPTGRQLVDMALANWYKPNIVLMPGVEAFDIDDGHELSSAIVLTLDTNTHDLRDLKAANDQLRKLPHVNGFPVYKPHITVGYVKREFADVAVERLKELEPRPFHTGDLDYGS